MHFKLFQDKNLLPLLHFVKIEVEFKGKVLQVKVKKYSSLKNNLRKLNGLNQSSVRFFSNGQRIVESDTPDRLGLSDGAVIEGFEEITGGGPGFKKRNIAGDQNRILDVLQSCEVSEEDAEKSSDKEDKEDPCNLVKTKKSEIEVQFDDDCLRSDQNRILDLLHSCEVSQDDLEISPDKDDKEDPCNLVKTKKSEIEVQFNAECFNEFQTLSSTLETSPVIETSSHVKQLRAPLIKEQLYQKELEEDIEIQNDNLASDEMTIQTYENPTRCQVPIKQGKKRKLDNGGEKVHKNKKNKVIAMEKGVTEIQSYNEPCDNSFQTPKKRDMLLSKFPIRTPSPLINLSKVTENEMRSFSIAVHVWADEYGGTNSLQQMRLTEEHFKEIVKLVGPGTRYNLLKGRSVLQYKSLWRNFAKSKQYFRGHPDTGFETKMKRHSSLKAFCPFEHCTSGTQSPLNPLEVDLLMTPKRAISDKGDLVNRNIFQQTPSATTSSLSTESVKESPTKEKLKHEIQLLAQKLERYEKNCEKKEVSKPYKLQLKCKKENCTKEFKTTFGMLQHMKKEHSADNNKMIPEKCNMCGKDFLYVDRHIKAVHSKDLGEEICEICKKPMKLDAKKHRGECIFCPICGKKEKKKIRLLNHISKCTPEQTKPMDLSSPFSKQTPNSKLVHNGPQRSTAVHNGLERFTVVHGGTKRGSESFPNLTTAPRNIRSLVCDVTQEDKSNQIGDTGNNSELKEVGMIDDETNDQENPSNESNLPKDGTSNLHCKRTSFPFDKNNGEEYMSEFEEDDLEEYTIARRETKDKIELRLRAIDGIKNEKQVGDDEIISKFRIFMKTVCNVGSGEEGSKDIQPSTVGMYTRAIQKDLLPALHQLFQPFDSRWLIDCLSEKICTFEGEERLLVSPTEPIYLTARVLRYTLSKYSSTDTGQQRSILLAACAQFMNFIELQFNEKLNVWGRKPLDKIMSYHNGVKSFINGTKVWKSCNKDRKKQHKNNQALKEINHQNFEAEILEKYQKYLKSSERLDQIKKIIHFASPDVEKPNNRGMTECSNICMGEIVASSGCRPVVTYRLTVGSYTSKKPGFNPYRVSKDDCVLEEEHGDKKLYRRLNPNLPPKDLACQHQLDSKSAYCRLDCEDKCEPEGFNIYCDWDKTSDTNGPSYLHLAKSIKALLDLYDVIKSKFFNDRKSDKGHDWLNKENTPFFVNSSGSPFRQIDLKHLSIAMGVDVRAYDFRRIVTTWAVSHESEEIRRYESETLQHSDKVAHDFYVQNKQLKPQTLIQTYIEEEGIIPDHMREEIKRAENISKSQISARDETRQKTQQQSMIKEKERVDKFKMENKPLGPKQRVLGADRVELRAIIEEITGEAIEVIVKRSKPFTWRQFIVRTLCTASGENGDHLRNLWSKVYKGDLKYGVRDVRFQAKEKCWPRKDGNAFLQKRDRNSWIAGTILKSFQAEIKMRATHAYIKLMK